MKILDLEDHMRITSAVPVVAGAVLGIVASAAVRGDNAAQQSAGRRTVIRPEKAPVSYTHLTLPTIYSV